MGPPAISQPELVSFGHRVNLPTNINQTKTKLACTTGQKVISVKQIRVSISIIRAFHRGSVHMDPEK